jgi:hypothetical protein
MKNFSRDDVGVMLSLRKDVEERGQRCKIYWCDKEITQKKIESYLRKTKATEAQILAKSKIPDPLPSHIVVKVLPDPAEAPPTLPNSPLDLHESNPQVPVCPGPASAGRPPNGPSPPKRRACVACRRSKAKCDFSGEQCPTPYDYPPSLADRHADGEGSSTASCIRCRQEGKDCVVRQSRRKRTWPVTRCSGKRKGRPSTTPEASSTSETSTSTSPYHVAADSEDATFLNLASGVNFGSDDSP